MFELRFKDDKTLELVRQIAQQHDYEIQSSKDKTKRLFIAGAMEGDMRLVLQSELDANRAYRPTQTFVLLAGNTVYSLSQVRKDWSLCQQHGLKKLTDYLYHYLSQCYTIAHYNKHGWIDYYTCYAEEIGYTPVQAVLRMVREGGELRSSIPRWASDRQRIYDAVFSPDAALNAQVETFQKEYVEDTDEPVVVPASADRPQLQLF